METGGQPSGTAQEENNNATLPSESESDAVVKCSACGTEISGVRFHCYQCVSDVDLCHSCWKLWSNGRTEASLALLEMGHRPEHKYQVVGADVKVIPGLRDMLIFARHPTVTEVRVWIPVEGVTQFEFHGPTLTQWHIFHCIDDEKSEKILRCLPPALEVKHLTREDGDALQAERLHTYAN